MCSGSRRILIFVVIILTCAMASADHDRNGNKEKELRNKNYSPLGEDWGRLHVIIQISDIHISKFYDRARVSDLKVFCTKHIDIIKPEVVIATGDLTDAKLVDLRGSRQWDDEWRDYQMALESTGVTNKTFWFDIRGNHDAFNVASVDDENNMYRRYSVLKRGDGSHHHVLESRGERLSFVGVDTVPDPGPRRPFNFFGLLSEETAAKLKVFEAESRSSDAAFWFGHYPSSVIYNTQPLREVLSRTGDVYMCGHLHTLNGMVPAMYTRHPEGNLELEVGDWKENRMYRVFSLDHGMLSLSDQRFDEWPVVMVTNPTHAQYAMYKHRETHLNNMLNSSHIRILVFHDTDIEHIKVKVDDVYLGQGRRQGDGPLYTVPWQPSNYRTGIHTVTVTIQDSFGRVVMSQHPFSLDATELPWSVLRHILLTSDFGALTKTLFLIGWVGYLVAMVTILILSHRTQVRRPVYGCWSARFLWRWIYKLQLLSLNNRVFGPLMVYHVYLAVGPWFIGDVIEGHIGASFVWGVYVKGAYIPGTLTYIYGLVQILLFSVPLTLYLAHCVDLSVRHHGYRRRHPSRLVVAMENLARHLLFYLFVILHGFYGFREFYAAYGTTAAVLGPVRTYSVVLAVVLRHLALNTEPRIVLKHVRADNGKLEHNN